MITNGFPPSYSDAVVNDAYFTVSNSDTTKLLGTYLTVGTSGDGDIVWENIRGEPQWLPGAIAGKEYIMGAIRILSSATVRGVLRTTTATALVWWAVNPLYNTP